MKSEKILICAWSLDLAIGGTETYMVRMAQWAQKVGIKCYFALKENCCIDPSWKDIQKINNVNIQYFRFNLLKSIIVTKEFSEVLKNNNCTLIATDIASYIRFLRYKTIFRLKNVNVLYYVLHPLVSKISDKKYINFLYKRLFIKEIENSFLYMDEECINGAKKIYKKNFDITNIYRLGCFINPLNTTLLEKKSQKNDFNILSISRMNFPFKGYQLGIVKSIPEIVENNPRISFTIIGDGPDSNILDEEILKLSFKYRKHIKRIGNVPYSEIEQYFRDANLYIGMGTTLLDASATGLPSIVATWDSYEPKSIGYFFNNWNNVGGDATLVNTELETYSSLISRISTLSSAEYLKISMLTYEQYRSNYNIDDIMPKILEISVKPQRISFLLSCFDFFLWKHRGYIGS